MTYVIRIQQFGGMKPSSAARALPDVGAQAAVNLDPTTMEFRPLDADTQVVANSGATNPTTLYRLDRKVDGSFNTDDDQRMGRAWGGHELRARADQQRHHRTHLRHVQRRQPRRRATYDVNDTSTGRQLGVPAPATKPTITVNVVDEFTMDERSSGIAAAYGLVTQAIRDALTLSWLGDTNPGTTTSGYVNYQDPPYTPITQAQQARCYRLASVNGADNGALVNTYSSAGPDAFTWIWDAQVHPILATSISSSPSWQGGSPGQYYDHLCIPFFAYGKGYSINTSQLTTALAAIARPGATAGEKLLTSDQISGTTGIVTRMTTYTNPAGTIKPQIDALKQKVSQIKVLLDGGATAAAAAQMATFYAKTDVKAVFDTAIANIADTIFTTADNCFHSSTPSDGYPGGPF
jgi:hypothetical protein